jgi:hypothetical protein
MMSRNLPTHPNLDHLKKQAKDLLWNMQQQDPALKLANAQHAIAREYGFLSWPKLKKHVVSLTQPVASTGPLTAEPPGDSGDTALGRDDGLPVTGSQSGRPEGPHLFGGKWTANLSKSRRHPSNPFQSATLQVAVARDTVTIIDAVVDASGREEQGKNTILADGKEHPSEHGNGYVLTARWIGPLILETYAKKDGQVAGWGRYEVSNDGETLTISGDDQVIVLDRTEGVVS